MKKRIVAEVSRNWSGGPEDAIKPLLCTTFERVIDVNMGRGYDLESWQLQIVTNPLGQINETIIAVFVLKEPQTV